jgi:capsular polysaccharide biosynthesis protein
VAGRALIGRVVGGLRRRVRERADRELRAVLAEHLPSGRGVVAVLVAAPGNGVTAGLRQAFPGAAVHEVTETGSASHVRLTVLAPFDVIVDARTPGQRVPRFLDAFYQLRDSGALVVAHGADELHSRGKGTLGELLAAGEAAKGEPYPSNRRGIPRAVLDAHGLGTVLAGTSTRGPHLVVVRGGAPTLAKLREPEMNDYLAARPERSDRVLDVIPAQPFRSRCAFRENTHPPRPDFPEAYETIDISLRLYHNVVVTPGQVLSTDRVITPDSYRHNQFPRLRNRATLEVAPRFARLKHATDDLPYIEGTYFHLDNEIRGHYGHLMTEQLSRMWAWPQAKAQYPDLKAVVAINKGHELRSWESEIYAAGGIAGEDILFLHGPVLAERVVSATPMLSNPDYVHPAIVPVWRTVGDNLAAGVPERDVPRRFFCSRRLAKRSCHNTEEVEELFAAQGFAILYPEDYSLGEQVNLFRNADVIAGFVGSGLFNLCFVDDPKRVIMIGSTAYTARNEYLIASLLGHRIDSVTCVPDDPTFYQSPFRFDALREGPFLAEVFASL